MRPVWNGWTHATLDKFEALLLTTERGVPEWCGYVASACVQAPGAERAAAT